jgi:hypothetical protein
MPNPSILKAQSQPSSEPKSRGANRSTKAAGKLKVLPEQPDSLLEVNRKPEWAVPGPSNDPEESTSAGTAGDSDDGDVDDDEPEVGITCVFYIRPSKCI